jgi:hypothetical protein
MFFSSSYLRAFASKNCGDILLKNHQPPSTVRRNGSTHGVYFRHQPNLELPIEQKGVQRLGEELESYRLCHVLLLLGE